MAGGGASSGLTAQFIFLIVIIVVFGLAALALIFKFIVYYCCYPDEDFDDVENVDKTKKVLKDGKATRDSAMHSLTAHVSHELSEVRKKGRRRRSRSRSRKSEKRNRKSPPEPSAPHCESVEGQALLFQAIKYDSQTSHGGGNSTSTLVPEVAPSESRTLAFSENRDLLETVFGADHVTDHDAEPITDLPSSEQLHRKRKRRRLSESGAGDARSRSLSYHGVALTPVMVRQYSSPLPSAPSAEELGFSEEDFLEGPPTYAESLTHSTQSLRDTVSLHENFQTA